MIKRGRDVYHVPKARGTKIGVSKLNEQQVKEIYLSKLGYKKLSKLYNVSAINIMYIKKKRQWKWLTDTLD